MWFYDNPFTYQRPKHIWLNFFIQQVGTNPYVEFAVNWSTPAWDSLGMGSPPLPGEDEMRYIGRQTFPVVLGWNTIDYTLPFNPEWVSIDFVAADVMTNGWIRHECVGTSLDLAFVITGHEGIPPDTGKNHFKTWRIQPQTFNRTVFVQDQFMEDSLRLVRIEFLSNPVQKVVQNDTFNITRPDDHLTWYRAVGRDTLLKVEYVNQFESTTVAIDSVKYLLVPTQKQPHAPPESLDHYKAYRIKDPVGFDWPCVLMDQFDSLYGMPESIYMLKPLYFLTPALKNMPPPMFDSVTHYVAYEIFPKRFFPITVNTFDQFGTHVLQVDTSKFLLVPTAKLRVTPPVKCGDVNNDGILGLGDVVYLISYQYKGGPAPVPLKCVGDVNNDDIVGLGDVVYLISYQYKGGPAPNPNCCNPPWVSE
jgi:hypothetical protein